MYSATARDQRARKYVVCASEEAGPPEIQHAPLVGGSRIGLFGEPGSPRHDTRNGCYRSRPSANVRSNGLPQSIHSQQGYGRPNQYP